MTDHQKEAVKLLQSMLREQTNMIQLKSCSRTSGVDLADFCAAFIRRYAENLARLDSNEYPMDGI
ncbi:MAG: hypothetical protein H0X43_04690 [Nitrosospira sp.]|nr:hypothetical protein [Nitrosospira sp.]